MSIRSIGQSLDRTAVIRLMAISVLSIAVAVYAFLGLAMRLMSDDYCYASEMLQSGLLGAIETYYQQWFGRVTQVVGASLFSTAPVWLISLLPALLLALWLITLVWAIREIGIWLRADTAPVLTALIILYATLAGTPQIFHSLYWISGIFPYTFPLLLFTALVALTVRAWRCGASISGALAALGLAFAAGAASEQFALVQLAALGSVLLWLIHARLWARSPVVVAGILGALGALAVVLASPGNNYRQTLFMGTHDPLNLTTQSVVYALGFVAASVTSFSPGAAAAAALLPVHLLPKGAMHSSRLAGLLVMFAFMLITVFNVPAIYATSLPPPARTYVVAQFVLVTALVAAGFLLRRLRPRRWNAAIVIVLLLAGPIYTSLTLLQRASNLAAYAESWDAQDQQIRHSAASGERIVVVAPLAIDLARSTGLDSLGSDPTYWINVCAAKFYGLESVSVR